MAKVVSNEDASVSTKPPPTPSPLRNAKFFQNFQHLRTRMDGLIRLMEGENTGPINIGNPGEFTMLELAEIIKELINPEVEISMVENTPDDPRQKKPDITKAKEVLVWEPKIKLRDGLPVMEADFRSRLVVRRNRNNSSD